MRPMYVRERYIRNGERTKGKGIIKQHHERCKMQFIFGFELGSKKHRINRTYVHIICQSTSEQTVIACLFEINLFCIQLIESIKLRQMHFNVHIRMEEQDNVDAGISIASLVKTSVTGDLIVVSLPSTCTATAGGKAYGRKQKKRMRRKVLENNLHFINQREREEQSENIPIEDHQWKIIGWKFKYRNKLSGNQNRKFLSRSAGPARRVRLRGLISPLITHKQWNATRN